jgi:hypothetical protein
MFPEGHSAGALTKEAALALVREALTNREGAQQYRVLVSRLRVLVEEFPDL